MTKRTFETEADIRNFKSKVLLLPKKLLYKVHQMIEDQKREWAIENLIKREYKGTLGVPTPPTIKTYILWYEAKKKLSGNTSLVPTRSQIAFDENVELVDIEKEHKTLLDNNTDVTNKKELLETLIKKCIDRMKKVENVQEIEGMTASLEGVLGHYLREIHNITTTQLKLSGELQDETNEVIAKLVNQNLYSLILIMFDAVREIKPEMVEPIKAKFYEKVQENKQLQEIMSQSSE